MIAQAPDPNITLQLLLAIGLLTTLAVNVATLMGMRKVQHREVTFAQAYASKQEVDLMREQMHMVDDKIESLRREGSDGRARLYAHVEGVRSQLSDKMDIIPDRVIVTLKNTGALGC